jgi:Zn-finger nucleic acid-binding protein
MKCPKCQQELESVVVHEVDVDRCPGCEGLWFDRSELGRLINVSKEELAPLLKGRMDPGLDVRVGSCPRDAESLVRVKSVRDREVVLDFCCECQGVWLDSGELRRLRDSPPPAK